MAVRFFDTSGVVKHYRVELGTATVAGLLAEAGSQHLISALSVVEMHSVFARLVRMGTINTPEFHLARGRFLADIAGGLWQVVPIADPHLQGAERLLIQHGLARSLRALDAVQLAVALGNPAGRLDAFVCADANLCQIAAAEGLPVVNPEIP